VANARNNVQLEIAVSELLYHQPLLILKNPSGARTMSFGAAAANPNPNGSLEVRRSLQPLTFAPRAWVRSAPLQAAAPVTTACRG
jgi:hypothetical protein